MDNVAMLMNALGGDSAAADGAPAPAAAEGPGAIPGQPVPEAEGTTDSAGEAAPAEASADAEDDLKLPWEDGSEGAEAEDGPSAEGVDERIETLREILGADIDQKLSKGELHRLWSVTIGSPRGQRIYNHHRVVSQIEERLGRQIQDPGQILSRMERAATLDEMIDSLHAGPEGAAHVLEQLLVDGRGQVYPWADSLKQAFEKRFAPDVASIEAQVRERTTASLMDDLLEKAAGSFRGGDQKGGEYWLRAANAIHFQVKGMVHPDTKDVQEGRWTRRAAASDAGAPPDARQPERPEKSPREQQLERELQQARTSQLSQRAHEFGSNMDADVHSAATEALAPLRKLVEAGVVTERVMAREADEMFEAVYRELGQEYLQDLRQKAKTAIVRGDWEQQDFLRQGFRQRIGKAVRSLRASVLEAYKPQIERRNEQLADGRRRQELVGSKPETARGGGPVAPAMTSRAPTGGRAGNEKALRELFAVSR